MRLNLPIAKFLMPSLCALALLLTSAAPPNAAAAPRAGTFVGQLEGLTDVIGIDVTQADEKNRRTVRAYLCDGEAGGDALWYSGVMVGNNVRLISADGKSTLHVKVGRTFASGSVTFENGAEHRFIAPPAAAGGGIYEVEVPSDGIMRGVSLAGDVFVAIKSPSKVSDIGDGRPWSITVTTASGETFQYVKYCLSSLSVAELESFGLPTIYATAGVAGAQPDVYTAVWLEGPGPISLGMQRFLFGRSGNVKLGVTGRNVLIFDLSEPTL